MPNRFRVWVSHLRHSPIQHLESSDSQPDEALDGLISWDGIPEEGGTGGDIHCAAAVDRATARVGDVNGACEHEQAGVGLDAVIAATGADANVARKGVAAVDVQDGYHAVRSRRQEDRVVEANVVSQFQTSHGVVAAHANRDQASTNPENPCQTDFFACEDDSAFNMSREIVNRNALRNVRKH